MNSPVPVTACGVPVIDGDTAFAPPLNSPALATPWAATVDGDGAFTPPNRPALASRVDGDTRGWDCDSTDGDVAADDGRLGGG